MCQIVPFTLPCCRKPYVEVTKLPSCPEQWPQKKCPSDLCIQVHGLYPEHRAAGICWRCTANAIGISGPERESLRPAIDKAYIVPGLEDPPISEKRMRCEDQGFCWFCSARGGCELCGSTKIYPVPEDTRYNGPKKRRRNGQGEDRVMTGKKRVKIEHQDRQRGLTPSMVPNPGMTTDWQQVYNTLPSVSTAFTYTGSGGDMGNDFFQSRNSIYPQLTTDPGYQFQVPQNSPYSQIDPMLLQDHGQFTDPSLLSFGIHDDAYSHHPVAEGAQAGLGGEAAKWKSHGRETMNEASLARSWGEQQQTQQSYQQVSSVEEYMPVAE